MSANSNNPNEVNESWKFIDMRVLNQSAEEVGREATESFGDSPETVMKDDDNNHVVCRSHEAIMIDCISVYQMFFVELLRTKVFAEGFVCDAYIHMLGRSPNQSFSELLQLEVSSGS